MASNLSGHDGAESGETESDHRFPMSWTLCARVAGATAVLRSTSRKVPPVEEHLDKFEACRHKFEAYDELKSRHRATDAG